MGCAVESCYPISPATTTLTYTTTEDGAAVTITTTSVTTSTPPDVSSVTGHGAVAKFFPSTVSKTEATASASPSSGSGSGGLSKGAVGGIVAAAALILIVVLIATFFIIKRLKYTEQVVQIHRETTSGTRTRQTTEKKSDVNVRVVPTTSEVDAMDYDPLMMNSSVASPQRPGHGPQMAHNRPRGVSDTASQPSIWSGQSATRWNTPSVNSDTDDNVRTTYFELPPRVHQPLDARPALRQSVNSNDSAYTYHNFAHAHGRNTSNASELSAGSDDYGSQHGVGSPLMPIELDVDGEFRSELPGSDTDTESKSGHRQPGPRRKGTVTSITDVVSPMSMRPVTVQASRQRRRGDSQIVSPMEGRAAVDGSTRSGLGSIDESASMTASNSLHGHYGPIISGREAGMENPPTVPGFVPHERPSQDGPEKH